MPFIHFIPLPLTSSSIQAYAPVASGVYGVSNAREWVFIGETDDIRKALLAYTRESGSPVMKHAPTGFVFEICDHASRSTRQERLVLEYEPACNRRLSRYSK